MSKFSIRSAASQGAFRWAIARYGKVAVAHTEAIITNRMDLVGFSSSHRQVREGNATGITFNIGPTPGRLLDVTGMVVKKDPYNLIREVQNTADGIIIAALTDEHLRLAKAAAAADMHCFVEKPIAGSVAEGQEMIDDFGKSKGKLVVGQVLPSFPEFELLRATILSQGIDQVESLKMKRFVPWNETDDEATNRVKGGAAPDLLVHDLHLIASVGKYLAVELLGIDLRYGLPQGLKLKVSLDGAAGKFEVEGGASRAYSGFHHSYDVRFRDGTFLAFDGEKVTGCEHEIAPRTVGEIFGNELQIAAEYFRGQRAHPSFLCPTMALTALQILSDVA